MSFLDNPAITKLALSSLKKHMQSSGVTAGAFKFDEQGEIDVQFHKGEVAIIPAEELAEMKRVYSAWLIGDWANPTPGKEVANG